MEEVTVSRRVATAPERVREAMADVGPFMRAAGFDEVRVADDGGTFALVNRVGIVELELELAVVERPDAAFAYEQRDGVFREMWTAYRVERDGDGSEVTATTAYELAARFVGPIFDGTVVKRQRRRELDAQFDYLAGLADGE